MNEFIEFYFNPETSPVVAIANNLSGLIIAGAMLLLALFFVSTVSTLLEQTGRR